jgi:ABC-2 type transport system permease protein
VSTIIAIALRELRSFFRLPVGWIVIALNLLLVGMVFGGHVLISGSPATLRYPFSVSGALLLPILPAISMRLLSEELRTGTVEPLMTAPVSDAGIVLGKYFGAVLFLIAMLAPTLAHVAILFAVSDPRPDLGPIVAGYISVLLLGLFYLAVGTLASALTSNQTLAFLATFLFLLLVWTLPVIAGSLSPSTAHVLYAISLQPRLDDFAKGVIDTAHIVFFLSATAWFLVLGVAAVGLRRWR